jgi:DNA-binding response OmpR family regulator
MSPGKILIVDDEADMRQLLAHLFETKGYEVVCVDNGRDAERKALEYRPALIVMDIGMPEMDGMTSIWKLREHQELAKVPIVILTAYDSYDLRAEAASAGCQAFITKPFEVSDFIAVIQRILK